MLIEFTKSRACRSQDNALVEGKNGAVIRKHMGYGHIPQQHAEQVHQFHTAHPNPYLNYHRPCGFATVTMDARGRRRRRYNPTDYATPNEKLKSLPEAKQYLKPGLGFAQLDQLAKSMSDTECARKMGAAKSKLLRSCKIESPFPPRYRCERRPEKGAMEMTGLWKAWKAKSRLPTFPSHFAITAAVLFSLIPAAFGCQNRRWAAEKEAIPQPPAALIFRIILYWNRNSISGSFFDWKILR